VITFKKILRWEDENGEKSPTYSSRTSHGLERKGGLFKKLKKGYVLVLLRYLDSRVCVFLGGHQKAR
jgi:hypothetical protein